MLLWFWLFPATRAITSRLSEKRIRLRWFSCLNAMQRKVYALMSLTNYTHLCLIELFYSTSRKLRVCSDEEFLTKNYLQPSRLVDRSSILSLSTHRTIGAFDRWNCRSARSLAWGRRTELYNCYHQLDLRSVLLSKSHQQVDQETWSRAWKAWSIPFHNIPSRIDRGQTSQGILRGWAQHQSVFHFWEEIFINNLFKESIKPETSSVVSD